MRRPRTAWSARAPAARQAQRAPTGVSCLHHASSPSTGSVGWGGAQRYPSYRQQHQSMGIASLHPSYGLSFLPTLVQAYTLAILRQNQKQRKRPCPFSKITSPSSRAQAPVSGARSRSAMRARARASCCSTGTRRRRRRPRRKSATPAARPKALRSTSPGARTASRWQSRSPTRSGRSRSWSTMPASSAATACWARPMT